MAGTESCLDVSGFVRLREFADKPPDARLIDTPQMNQQRYFNAPHEIHDLLETALSRHASLFRDKVRAEMHEGEIVLSGIVGSYYHKQLAQESLRSLAGTTTIR